jgi:TolB protein
VNDDGTRTRLKIADDPDWSPDGEHIAFTAHDVGDEGPNWPLPPFRSKTAEIFVIAADGSGTPQQLTHNLEEERGPVWSPDGNRIAFACRAGTRMSEICVMNADGSNVQQLTSNTVPDLTPTFSPDGQQIVFHRDVPGQGDQLWLMNADGTPLPDGELEEELTSPPGINLLAHWGELRIRN